ncbi:MAG: DoxX family protein [Deltaproteobacteria bacterium]|nr:DoxX family protein [Deltaproteobacteria bacterium]
MAQTLSSLLGRLLLALIFILSGISKIGNYESTVSHMSAAGMPAAPFFLYAAVLIELGCGLSLASGFRARLGALILFAFMIPVTYIFHFKAAFTSGLNVASQEQVVSVLKNLAIMGGLLLVYGNGAGKLTIGKDA